MSITLFLMFFSLFTCGAYLLLSGRFSDFLIGAALMSNAINLLIIEASHSMPEGVDALPQALILTAIVIGFALISFLATYILRRCIESGADTIHRIGEEEVKP